MTCAYRYSKERYTNLLLAMGVVKVGTLHDFRRTEHGKGIADPHEGKKRVKKDIDLLRIEGSDDPNAHILEEFRAIKLGPSTNVTLENVRLARSFDHPDCFVLCSSSALSEATMAEFEGADSCVEISNPNLFYEQLTHALNKHVPVVFRGVFRVAYQVREEDWNGMDWGRHPALIKEPTFIRQHELRAIWTPRFQEPIAPIVVANYRLTEACRETHV